MAKLHQCDKTVRISIWPLSMVMLWYWGGRGEFFKWSYVNTCLWFHCANHFLFSQFSNFKVYCVTYKTNIRHICTYLNPFFMVITNIVMKINNFVIFDILCSFDIIIVCSLQVCMYPCRGANGVRRFCHISDE